MERVEGFMARYDVMAARALGHLAWFTMRAGAMPESGVSAG